MFLFLDFFLHALGSKQAEVPGFEPGSRDPKPLMLSTNTSMLLSNSENAYAMLEKSDNALSVVA